jgi:hypothetical protein
VKFYVEKYQKKIPFALTKGIKIFKIILQGNDISHKGNTSFALSQEPLSFLLSFFPKNYSASVIKALLQ